MSLVGNSTAFAAAIFDHRALIQRNDADDTDHRAASDWDTHIAAQPCFYYFGRKGEESVVPERTAVVEGPALLLPLGADVTEGDRVNGITHKDGSTIVTGLLEILTVTRHHTQLEATLRAVA